MTEPHPADDFTRDIPPDVLSVADGARLGVSVPSAYAVIQALLMLGWRPPPAPDRPVPAQPDPDTAT